MTPEDLTKFSNKLFTTVGGVTPGEKSLFMGFDLHRDLVDIEWFDLYLFGITGKRLQKNKLELLQTIWTYTSYPDARIWNNRVVALAAGSRSTSSLAIASGLAISEAEIYGTGVSYKAISFLVRTLKNLKNNLSIDDCIQEEFSKYGQIPGYGRPLSTNDERIEPIINKAKSLKLVGSHIKLAYDIEKKLLEKKKRRRLKMNYAAVAAALAADIGLSPQQYYQFIFTCFLAGMPPCYIENVEKLPGTLFPTACKDIKYEGVGKRSWQNRFKKNHITKD